MQTRTEARRQAMLDAATELFLEKGYQHTTLCDILMHSKGSRSTLYKLFGNKEGLLQTMIQEATDQVWQTVADWHAGDPRLNTESLTDLGCRFFKSIMAPNAVATYRILISEGYRIPSITEFFVNSGPECNKAQLIDWFAKAQDAGILVNDPPSLLVEVFLGMVMGDLHLRCTLGVAAVPDDTAIERRVRASVEIFLNGALAR